MPAEVTAKLNTTHEIRLAVVMYGGVSLAIYINGVAQELLRLVRATAPARRDDPHARPLPASGTERVYRKLSYLLADPALLTRCRATKTDGRCDLGEVDAYVTRGETVHTRFVVDVLAGTSAGGINAVHLSKALANDQDIGQLKDLWLNEGDLDVLVNDRASVAGLPLDAQTPPQSLLNSRRMYLKLLKSLDDMGEAPSGHESPFVDELDLFITTTDIEGVPLPLQLSDAVVWERRHRNVFHFRYSAPDTGEKRNDFEGDDNPFLAFAARCTSAFPFAFEPMRLCDIDEVLRGYRRPGGGGRPHRGSDAADRWGRFFKLPVDPRTGQANVDFAKRSFGDGGYLDNKPFSYATEALTRRTARVPVDRKLFYVEPSPEHPEDAPGRAEKPTALENVLAALLELPRYETIREDLQRVLRRNRLIRRVNRLTENVQLDLERHERRTGAAGRETGAGGPAAKVAWVQKDLADMVASYGIHYLPYRRLRVAAVTDGLANLVARAANFDEGSDYGHAVRCVVQAWRLGAYVDYREPADAPTRPTTNAFLDDFDYGYRVRRLTLLRDRVDRIYALLAPGAASRGLEPNESEGPREPNGTDERGDPNGHRGPRAGGPSVLVKRLRGAGLDVNTLGDAERLAGRALLLRLKRGLDAVFRDLRQAGRAVRGSRGASAGAARRPAESSAPAFTEAIRDLCITTRHLRYVLGVPLERLDDASALTTAARSANDAHDYDDTLWLERANRLLYDPPGDLRAPPELRAKLDAAAGSLRASLADAFGAASARTRALLDPGRPLAEALGDPELRAAFGALDTPDALDAPYARPIRAVLWDYYLYFEHYDQISFPIFYDTDVGEADVIDVVRVSPEDATALIDERDELERLGPERARRKLAGTALSNFGAFLDRTWRKNDILWGRLDGAERLVSAMLPGAENDGVRAALIEEAHATVLAEEMGADSRGELQRVMGEALLGASMGDPVRQAVEAVLARAQNASPLPTRLRTVLQSALAGDALLPYVRERYAVDRQLDPKPLLRTVARSTQIIGRMFEDLASRQGYEGKRLGWIARLGALFWGLVEIAVPGSLLNLMVRHWFKVLFAFEIFLVVSALLLGSDAVLRFAVTALAVTTLLGLATLILHDWMRLRRGWLRASLGAVAAAVLALAAVGADELFDLGVRQRLCDRVEGVRAGWGQGLCRVVASAQVVAAPAGGGTNAGR